MPSECGRMRRTLRGESTERSAARSCGLRLRRVERAVCVRGRSCPWGKGTTLYHLYHPSATSRYPSTTLYHPSKLYHLPPSTALSRGAPPVKSSAVGHSNPRTSARNRLCHAASEPSTSSSDMPYAQQAHSSCHSVTSRPSFSLSQTHGSRSRLRFGIIPRQMGAWGCSRTQISPLFLQLEASRDFIPAIFELRERGSRILRWQVPPALRSSARTERAHHVSII